MERPLLRSTSFGLGIFSSVITGVLEFVAIIPVIGVVFSAIESVVIGAVGSYYFNGSSGALRVPSSVRWGCLSLP